MELGEYIDDLKQTVSCPYDVDWIDANNCVVELFEMSQRDIQRIQDWMHDVSGGDYYLTFKPIGKPFPHGTHAMTIEIEPF